MSLAFETRQIYMLAALYFLVCTMDPANRCRVPCTKQCVHELLVVSSELDFNRAPGRNSSTIVLGLNCIQLRVILTQLQYPARLMNLFMTPLRQRYVPIHLGTLSETLPLIFLPLQWCPGILHDRSNLCTEPSFFCSSLRIKLLCDTPRPLQQIVSGCRIASRYAMRTMDFHFFLWFQRLFWVWLVYLITLTYDLVVEFWSCPWRNAWTTWIVWLGLDNNIVTCH